MKFGQFDILMELPGLTEFEKQKFIRSFGKWPPLPILDVIQGKDKDDTRTWYERFDNEYNSLPQYKAVKFLPELIRYLKKGLEMEVQNLEDNPSENKLIDLVRRSELEELEKRIHYCEKNREIFGRRQTEDEIAKSQLSKHLNSQSKRDGNITAPQIALFCNLMDKSHLLKKDENENVEKYCKRICENFNLKYSDRVRQNFQNIPTSGNVQKLKELILPYIQKDVANTIIDYLDNKQLTKQKLYS